MEAETNSASAGRICDVCRVLLPPKPSTLSIVVLIAHDGCISDGNMPERKRRSLEFVMSVRSAIRVIRTNREMSGVARF